MYNSWEVPPHNGRLRALANYISAAHVPNFEKKLAGFRLEETAPFRFLSPSEAYHISFSRFTCPLRSTRSVFLDDTVTRTNVRIKAYALALRQ